MLDDWLEDTESKIQIIVQANPHTELEFAFSATGDIGNVTLVDDGDRSTRSHTKAFVRLAPGTYEITQGLPDEDGWELTGIQCVGTDEVTTDLVNRIAIIDLSEGKNVRCTFENTGSEPVSVEEEASEIPDIYILSQNYPNPFNPTTIIEFALPEANDVRLMVYDILGRRVARLVDEIMQPGYHKVKFDASHLASGMYIYQIQAGEFTKTRKLTLLK